MFLNACGSGTKKSSTNDEAILDPNIVNKMIFTQDQQALEDFEKGVRIYTITQNGKTKDAKFDEFYKKYMLINHGITIEHNPSNDASVIKYYSTMNAEITKEHEEGFFSFTEERAKFLYETSSPVEEEDSSYISKHK